MSEADCNKYAGKLQHTMTSRPRLTGTPHPSITGRIAVPMIGEGGLPQYGTPDITSPLNRRLDSRVCFVNCKHQFELSFLDLEAIYSD